MGKRDWICGNNVPQVVGNPCNTAVTLHHCDTAFSPPKCRQISAEYVKGCEQIQVHQ